MKKNILLLFISICSCSKYSSEVDNALRMAGNNKKELVKVLEYYKEGGHKEKLKAAEFLISNLPYNYSYDTTNLYKFRSVFRTYDSIKKTNKKIHLNEYINKFWDRLKIYNSPYHNIYSKPVVEDIKIIKSDFLIKNINQAYASWKDNPYTRDSVSFDDFCEYILPYRKMQGKAIENWRAFFVKENTNHFADAYPASFNDACDSLLVKYKDYKFDFDLLQGLPLLKFKDFMKIKSGKCTAMSWLNTYIFASKGIPIATDFVPAWGHRREDHQWNAFVYGSKSVYFDSFWESHVSIYKSRMYNNNFESTNGGIIRVAKVYRNTFATHLEGPISNSDVKFENIPPLFLNVKKRDVSDSYFKHKDVIITLTNDLPKNTYYAYLCVVGNLGEWIPVQWGEIKGEKVEFKKMGRDIVYQTAYYKNGRVVPFGHAFHLNYKGEMTLFKSETLKREIVIKRKYPARKYGLNEADSLRNSLIQASNRSDFRDAITFEKINYTPELRPYEINVKLKSKFRYFRILSKNRIKLENIDVFYTDSKGKEHLLDKSYFNNETAGSNGSTWIGVDLGEPNQVTKIIYEPVSHLNHVLKDLNYELFYIDQGEFISLGRKRADNTYELRYNNVPKNALLYLKCLDTGKQERIFEYKNGKQIWY